MVIFHHTGTKPRKNNETVKLIFSTTSGSTGKPKILEFENKWMGEFPIYTKDVQGPGDIFKLCGKFGCSRTMKIAKGKNNLGKLQEYRGELKMLQKVFGEDIQL